LGAWGRGLSPSVANGSPAFGQYRPRSGGGHEACALQVLEIADGRIVGLNSFLDTPALFPLFGLPLALAPDEAGGGSGPWRQAARRSQLHSSCSGPEQSGQVGRTPAASAAVSSTST